jgi:heme-degrading monooxygenase HmoA
MFGRQVTMKLKANAATELTRIAESEIIPILRRQKGFRDETFFIAGDRTEAIANSFWDTAEDAEAYSQTSYPEVLRTLANTIEGIPTVRIFNFVISTRDRTFTGKLP